MRFTLRQLEYYVATCDAGSLTEAALALAVAQSSVSTAIAQLESALGVQLLIRRHAQGVTPTPAGRTFLVRARALLRDAGDLERFGDDLTKEVTGTLELGCLRSLAPFVTPRLCRQFRAAHPAAAIELLEAAQEQLVAQLRAGGLSVLLTYDLELGDDIDFEPLAELPPYAMLAAEHPFAGRPSVDLAELAEEPMVVLDLPDGREYLDELFTARGLQPTVGYRSAHPEVIRTMVANGYGYALVNARPRIDHALDGEPVVTVRIAGEPRPLVLGVATLRDVRPTRVVDAFREHCRASISADSVPGLRVDG